MRDFATRFFSPDGESGAADGQDAGMAAASTGVEAGTDGGAGDATGAVDGTDGGDAGADAAAVTPSPSAGLVARVGQLTRQKRELEERLAALQQGQLAAPVDPQTLDPETARRTIDLEINRRARLMAEQEDWARTTDRVWNEGLSRHGDWATQINTMNDVLGGIPRSLTEAAIATGSPVDVLYELAKNPEKAMAVAGMSVARQGVELAKMAQGLSGGAAKPAPRVSNAPPPVTPRVNGAGAAPAAKLDDPNISMEDWARLRNEQVRNRRR